MNVHESARNKDKLYLHNVIHGMASLGHNNDERVSRGRQFRRPFWWAKCTGEYALKWNGHASCVHACNRP